MASLLRIIRRVPTTRFSGGRGERLLSVDIIDSRRWIMDNGKCGAERRKSRRLEINMRVTRGVVVPPARMNMHEPVKHSICGGNISMNGTYVTIDGEGESIENRLSLI